MSASSDHDAPVQASPPPAHPARHVPWDSLDWEEVTDSIRRRIITGDGMMIAQVFLDQGAVVPKHSHLNEQITYIVSGALHFRLGEDLDREVTVRAGEVLHIPAHLPHEATALEDTLDVDVFSPPRADWLDGSDAYFHAAPAEPQADGASEPVE
ncbi:MAG: cupin domain-containing protein [Gemmatimonadales bacterium]|nr:MAG: cupin domain-containing protein [Gemmatimonadales bacterium]